MKIRENTTSYSEYRHEINRILESNSNIKITNILDKCNISKGNFYVFMNGGKDYNGTKVSTLSYKKLDTLLNELKKYDSSTTNRQVLQSLSTFQLNNYIQEKFIYNPNLKDIDIEAWLNSTKEDLIYKNNKKK